MKLLILTFLLLIHLSLNTQVTENTVESELKLWSFSCAAAGVSKGPLKEIENVMEETGFGEYSPGFWGWGGSSHPYSRLRKASFIWCLKRHIKPLYSIGINFGNTDFGETVGYHDQAGHLFIDSSVFSISPFISLNYYDILRLGAGPAFHFARSWKTSGSSTEESEDYVITKVGFTIDTGIRAPWRSTFFVDFITQYRKVGEVEMGPFTAEFVNEIAEFPKTKVNFDHWIFGLGIGLRW